MIEHPNTMFSWKLGKRNVCQPTSFDTGRYLLLQLWELLLCSLTQALPCTTCCSPGCLDCTETHANANIWCVTEDNRPHTLWCVIFYSHGSSISTLKARESVSVWEGMGWVELQALSLTHIRLVWRAADRSKRPWHFSKMTSDCFRTGMGFYNLRHTNNDDQHHKIIY